MIENILIVILVFTTLLYTISDLSTVLTSKNIVLEFIFDNIFPIILVLMAYYALNDWRKISRFTVTEKIKDIIIDAEICLIRIRPFLLRRLTKEEVEEIRRLNNYPDKLNNLSNIKFYINEKIFGTKKKEFKIYLNKLIDLGYCYQYCLEEIENKKKAEENYYIKIDEETFDVEQEYYLETINEDKDKRRHAEDIIDSVVRSSIKRAIDYREDRSEVEKLPFFDKNLKEITNKLYDILDELS